jgi:hypothetical protein
MFGYVTTAQLSGADDPIEVLRSADSEDALLRLDSFSPSATSDWARSGVTRVGPIRNIANEEDDSQVEVAVCALA